jgi:lysozyme family protein
MTVKQKQLILCCFELLTVEDVDGIWGKQTEAATRKLQRGLGITEDGVFGDGTLNAALDRLASGESLEAEEKAAEVPVTGTFWDGIEFFTREEFRCQCGGKYCSGFPVEPQEQMVRTADEIRRRLGVPVSIVDSGGSGVRCARHNANVGGVANSLHLTGNAADLHSEKSPEEMAQVAEKVMGATGEIGIYSWGIHVGIGKYSRFYG